MSSSKSRPSGSSSSARKPTAPSKNLTSEQIREKESKEFLLASLQSHAGWLNKPIASLSDTIDMDITYTSSILGIVYLVFLLISPAFLTPHISALITSVIPVQCTVRTVVMEKVKDVKQSQNAPQWVFYWVIYVLWGMARGWISTFRPGHTAVFEVVRTVGLVVVGGPWFGRAGLRPDPPSEELKKAEKEEAVKAGEKKKLADKDKLKKDKAKKEAAAKAKKQKEKERAKRAKA